MRASIPVEVLCYWSDGRCEHMEFDGWPQRGDLPADAVRFDIAWPDPSANSCDSERAHDASRGTVPP